MIVLDTHVWLWWLVAPRRLSRAASQTIDRAAQIGVSAISVFELADLVERGRIKIDTRVRAWTREAFAVERVQPLPVTPDVAIDAAQLRFASDPFDRIIYATARAEDALLVTRDERLHAFDPERTVW